MVPIVVRSLLAASAVVPFLPLAPSKPALAGVPACTPNQLRASVSLQGATGSLLGGFALRNVGSRACVLLTPLRLSLRDPSGRALPLGRQSPDSPLGARQLRLDPGQAGAAELQLGNACDPSSKAHLWVVLPRRAGRVDLGIGAGGRCDVPGKPAVYGVGALQQADPPPLSSEQKGQRAALRVAAIGAPRTTRAGTTLTYTVSVANLSSKQVRARSCPHFYEQLWLWKQDVVITHQFLLNCRPIGDVFAAHSTSVFEMRLEVPRDLKGSADIDWGLEDRMAPIPTRVSMNELLNSSVGVNPYSSSHVTLRVTAPKP